MIDWSTLATIAETLGVFNGCPTDIDLIDDNIVNGLQADYDNMMGASIIALAGLLGLIPMLVLAFIAMYKADKRETNRGKLDRLGEIQIDSVHHQKSIDELIPMMPKHEDEAEH
jgi:hypothetical protein